MAEINNISPDTLISGSNRSDTIYNYSANSSISGDAGDDYLDSKGDYYSNGEVINVDKVTMSGGDGKDTIFNGTRGCW